MKHQTGGAKVAKRSNGVGPARIDPRLILAAIVESTDDAIIGKTDVLIVEEDAGFARLLEAELIGRGLTAVSAGDVETAEHLLLDGMKPRAVVLDIMLPGVQGEGFLSRLGARNGDKRPTVVLTVRDLDAVETAILERAAVAAALAREAGATQAVVALIVQALGPRLVKS